MRIEAKSTIKDTVEGRFFHISEGDQVTVPDSCAYWVANGWAKNLDTGEDNEPSRDPVTLETHNAGLGVKTSI